MALILKRKTTKPVQTTSDDAERTAPNFLADANEKGKASPVKPTAPELRETHVPGPKKLVIKGKKKPGTALPEQNKAVEPPVEPVEAPRKAFRPRGPVKCSFCGYERMDPCHGSQQWRGSTAADGTKLECADKRLVKRLRSEGKDQFGQPLNEQRERDAVDDCASGLHSWIDVEGKLDPSCECRFCGERVGEKHEESREEGVNDRATSG